MSEAMLERSPFALRVVRSIGFIFFFLKELWVSSVRVAVDVVKPTISFEPGVIAFPLRASTDMEIMLLANVISLTPGTLSLDVSEDRKILYIHAMYATDPDAVRMEIREGLEKRLLEAVR
jgi:multicomponent Na+:H+ antiporter subunit E